MYICIAVYECSTKFTSTSTMLVPGSATLQHTEAIFGVDNKYEPA